LLSHCANICTKGSNPFVSDKKENSKKPVAPLKNSILLKFAALEGRPCFAGVGRTGEATALREQSRVEHTGAIAPGPKGRSHWGFSPRAEGTALRQQSRHWYAVPGTLCPEAIAGGCGQRSRPIYSMMTEWPKVTGCKPADKRLRRFESCSC
jgi:hypothetical protein